MRALRKLDAALGRISMYRLVLLALVLITVYAAALGFAGVLSFDGIAILVSAVVAIAATAAGTLLGGLVTRSTPHLSSSLITGLILALVLWPGFGDDLLAVAIAGFAAGISKYLLAWRGRHIINPAVVGLLVVGLSGLSASVWWVGSDVIAPVVALLGAVIVWRTRRSLFALSYLVPAVVLTTIGYLNAGTDLSDASRLAVLVSPILFLGLFMLTEPLTSPPRLWQRVVVGALVAVLSVLPLFVHVSFLTPELALAVGNVLAFVWGMRGGVRLRFVAGQAHGDLLDLRFTASAPLRMQPGQYLEVDVPQAARAAMKDPRGRRRVLSIASDPRSDEVRLITRMTSAPGADPSPVKRALATLQPGDELPVTSVGGDFLLPDGGAGGTNAGGTNIGGTNAGGKNAGGKVALIAAGVGITPFLSHLDAVTRGSLPMPKDLVLVNAVRDVAQVVELPGSEGVSAISGGGVLGALPARAGLPTSISIVLVVPPGSDVSTVPVGWRVIEGETLTADVLAAAVPDLAEREVLVSGSPLAVEAVRVDARAAGVKRLHTDAFLGY